MNICGIDPGKTGALCCIDDDGNVIWTPMPCDKDNMINAFEFNLFLKMQHDPMIFLEKVGGRGGWGASQMFNFGMIYGQIRLVIADKTHRLITPQGWQKVAHDGINKKLKPKDRSKAAIKQLIPGFKGNDGLMDAFLIAYYGMSKYSKRIPTKWTITKWLNND